MQAKPNQQGSGIVSCTIWNLVPKDIWSLVQIYDAFSRCENQNKSFVCTGQTQLKDADLRERTKCVKKVIYQEVI
jgi:hypothetical protein